MATKNKNLSNTDDLPSGEKFRIGIVVADWNAEITSALLAGCQSTLIDAGVQQENIRVIHVPGSFELPTGARLLSGSRSYDAIICLGCVIKGETRHNEYIANAVANGLIQLSLLSNKPVIFGLLTPDNMEQARARSGGMHGNKGVEAAVTALKMAALKQHIGQPGKKIGFA